MRGNMIALAQNTTSSSSCSSSTCSTGSTTSSNASVTCSTITATGASTSTLLNQCVTNSVAICEGGVNYIYTYGTNATTTASTVVTMTSPVTNGTSNSSSIVTTTLSGTFTYPQVVSTSTCSKTGSNSTSSAQPANVVGQGSETETAGPVCGSTFDSPPSYDCKGGTISTQFSFRLTSYDPQSKDYSGYGDGSLTYSAYDTVGICSTFQIGTEDYSFEANLEYNPKQNFYAFSIAPNSSAGVVETYGGSNPDGTCGAQSLLQIGVSSGDSLTIYAFPGFEFPSSSLFSLTPASGIYSSYNASFGGSAAQVNGLFYQADDMNWNGPSQEPYVLQLNLNYGGLQGSSSSSANSQPSLQCKGKQLSSLVCLNQSTTSFICTSSSSGPSNCPTSVSLPSSKSETSPTSSSSAQSASSTGSLGSTLSQNFLLAAVTSILIILAALGAFIRFRRRRL